MRRREFITLVGGAAAAWPLAARAQQPAVPVIGFLNSASPQAWKNYVAGFRTGLKETGYVEGQNVAIEFRWAEGHYDRLPGMAADLVRRKVAVLVSTGGEPSVLAAKAATTTIPIVFTSGVDPIRGGFVSSLSRPGGNITGVNLFLSAIESKRLGLLRALVPGVKLIAVLLNPNRQGGHSTTEFQCPLLGVKRTRLLHCKMSAYDPKRTSSTSPRMPSQGNFRD
jgi:putative ABC transport system substrate-binding protein